MLIDSNGDGNLTLDELITQIPRLRGNARGIDMLALRKGIPAFMLDEVSRSSSPSKKQMFQFIPPKEPSNTAQHVQFECPPELGTPKSGTSAPWSPSARFHSRSF